MAQVLEFASKQTRRTLLETKEVFLRDRKSTVRGIAKDTEDTYNARLGVFTTWAAGRGVEHIDEVDADVIDAFFLYLRDERKNPQTGEPLGDNTIRDYFLSLRAFFRALHERGTISRNPIAHKKAADFSEPEEIERFTPTADDMARILALFDGDTLYTKTDFGEAKIRYLRARNKAILGLMYDCGLRSREVCNLETARIDFDYRKITYVAKGRRRGREKQRINNGEFGLATRQLLLAYQKQRDAQKFTDQRFFLTCEGTPMGTTAIRRLFRTVADAVKLPKFTPHAVRRAAITDVVKEHGLRAGQRFANHAASTTTERYDTRPKEEVLAEIASGDRVGSLLRR